MLLSNAYAFEQLYRFVYKGFPHGESKLGSEYWWSVVISLRIVAIDVDANVGLMRVKNPPDLQSFIDAKRYLMHAFNWAGTKQGRDYWYRVFQNLMVEYQHFSAKVAAGIARAERAARNPVSPTGMSPPGGHLKPLTEILKDAPWAVIDDPEGDLEYTDDDVIAQDVGLHRFLKSLNPALREDNVEAIAATLMFRVARLIRDEVAATKPENDNIETVTKRLVSVFSALIVYARALGVDLVEAVGEDIQS